MGYKRQQDHALVCTNMFTKQKNKTVDAENQKIKIVDAHGKRFTRRVETTKL